MLSNVKVTYLRRSCGLWAEVQVCSHTRSQSPCLCRCESSRRCSGDTRSDLKHMKQIYCSYDVLKDCYHVDIMSDSNSVVLKKKKKKKAAQKSEVSSGHWQFGQDTTEENDDTKITVWIQTDAVEDGVFWSTSTLKVLFSDAILWS